jgi:hypothetical protein
LMGVAIFRGYAGSARVALTIDGVAIFRVVSQFHQTRPCRDPD